MSAGILTGCDVNQEWLLPWFYVHFRRFNPTCPIAFADFGMSSTAKNWCKERGLISEISESRGEHGSILFQGDLFEEWNRSSPPLTRPLFSAIGLHMRKPAALIESPFQKTLWVDLDCQIRGNLSSLLTTPLSVDGLGACPSGSYVSIKNLSKEVVFLGDKYNSGVILTQKESPLLREWASYISEAIAFETEEGYLTFLVEICKRKINALPKESNWTPLSWGMNDNALIYHWMGGCGKEILKALV